MLYINHIGTYICFYSESNLSYLTFLLLDNASCHFLLNEYVALR